MLVIRPVALTDLEALLELARLTTFGLTTLPKERELLSKRIRSSIRGFEDMDEERPHGQSWLFVLEDRNARRIIGTVSIVSKVGGFEPFYAYRLETSVHESRTLGVHKEIQVLHLVREHNGPSEIGSLFLHPDYRRGGIGRILSLSRFLFIAEHTRLIDPVVIAEMRGVIDREGRSPFWDALGRHFFEVEFPKADMLSIVNKEFIGELMPEHPIYVPLLPKEARQVIGEVHPETRPARRLLESEGFRFSGMVDIFEGGPILECRRDEIRSVRESRRATIARKRDVDPDDGIPVLVATTGRDFRAVSCSLPPADVRATEIALPGEVVDTLQRRPGDTIWLVPLRKGGGDLQEAS